MPEGPAAETAPKRGRRDPDLAAKLAAEQILESNVMDAASEQMSETIVSVVGTTLFARTSCPIPLREGWEPAWFSFGITDSIGDRTLEDAIDQMIDICNTGVLRAADEMNERLDALEQQRDNEPIAPRR